MSSDLEKCEPASNILSQSEQLALENIKDERQYKFALANLDATARDREAQRIHLSKMIKFRSIVAAGIIVSILIFLGVILYFGKDSIVLELLKDVALFAGGGGVGYSISLKKILRTQEETTEN